MARIHSESRLRARRRKRRAIIAGLALFVLLLSFAGVAALMRASFWRIRTISVVGTSTIATSSIAQLAQEDISGTYWLLFPKDNILLYPRQTLMAGVLSAFPTVRSVSIHAATFSQLEIDVSERQPVAQWCGQTPAASSSDCMLMDGSGLLYASAPSFSMQVYTPYYGSIAGSVSNLPVQFLTPAQFQALQPLARALAQAAQGQGSGIFESVWVDGNSDVHLEFQSGFELLFSLGDDSGTVLNHLNLALQSSALTGHQLSDLSYLDLRFGDRLYYKLK